MNLKAHRENENERGVGCAYIYCCGNRSILRPNMVNGMTPVEPVVADTWRYNVTQTCEALGIHRNTLERYRKNNLIRCGKRRTSDRKYYTGAEIKRLWRIL